MKSRVLALIVVSVVLAAQAASGAAFNDPTNVNVLREYSETSYTKLVTSVYSATGDTVTLRNNGATDGGGWNDEAYDIMTGSDTITGTFTLPRVHTVGSYSAHFETPPIRFILEGSLDNENWTVLSDAVVDGAQILSREFDPTAVQYLRYTASGPTADTTRGYFRMYELQVFLAATETADLTEGFNYTVDQAPTGHTCDSSNPAVWVKPNGGNALTIADGVFTNELKAQQIADEGGNRSFVILEFPTAERMSYATLGGRKGQGWRDGWECYTASGDSMPDLQGLAGSDPQTIQDAGWTLQYATDTGNEIVDFTFAEPGDYKYVALVWNVTFGAETEFELFGAYIPPEVTSFGIAAQADGSTTETDEPYLTVTSFTAVPSDLGTQITGYLINENPTPPALDDLDWMPVPLPVYTLNQPEGLKTVYAWVKDDAGKISMASQQILYQATPGVKVFDPTKINVLRKFDTETATNLVTCETTSTGTTTVFRAGAAFDGSGWNAEANGMATSEDTMTETFTLPDAVKIGSFMLDMHTPPVNFLLEASADGTNYLPLWEGAPTSGINTGSFEPLEAKYIRYTAFGGETGDGWFRMHELQIYAASTVTINLTDGYSYMRDQNPQGIMSENSTVWTRRNGGDLNTLKDAKFDSNELKAQDLSPDGGNKAFVAYEFELPVPMACATLGGTLGQGWNGFAVYTANGDVMPELQNLTANDPATLQAAGWILQYERPSDTRQQLFEFAFVEPGDYKYIVLVWDQEWGAAQEFELFGAAEPVVVLLDGDANGDCKVNIIDLIFIRNRLNKDVTTGDNAQADVNGDGKVNIIDLIYVRNRLNNKCE